MQQLSQNIGQLKPAAHHGNRRHQRSYVGVKQNAAEMPVAGYIARALSEAHSQLAE
jgi:hypothetical protein